jgi:hypothetical protein
MIFYLNLVEFHSESLLQKLNSHFQPSVKASANGETSFRKFLCKYNYSSARSVSSVRMRRAR